jgi:hypothetical protein
VARARRKRRHDADVIAAHRVNHNDYTACLCPPDDNATLFAGGRAPSRRCRSSLLRRRSTRSALRSAGVPAVALVGTSWPAWLRIKAGLRRVALAFDADEAGDRAAEKLDVELRSFGSKVERWRPEGAKDWNEALQALCEELIGRFGAQVCHACGRQPAGYTPGAWLACAEHLAGGARW